MKRVESRRKKAQITSDRKVSPFVCVSLLTCAHIIELVFVVCVFFVSVFWLFFLDRDKLKSALERMRRAENAKTDAQRALDAAVEANR